MAQSEENLENESNEETPHPISSVTLCGKASTAIFLLNLILIATVAGLARRYPSDDGFTSSIIIYKGSCKLSSRLDLALHLIINALSTGILAASSYCMQTLVAPSREEIDARHAQYQWLDIGCLSARNLFTIGRYRLALWMVLLVTATPFHLLYNSMIFRSQALNENEFVLGPKDLNSTNIWSLTTPALEKCFRPGEDHRKMDSGIFVEQVTYLSWTEFASNIAQGNYDRLSLDQCIHSIETQPDQGGFKSIIMLGDNLSVIQGGDTSILLSTRYFNIGEDGSHSAQVASFANKTLAAQGVPMVCNNISQLYSDPMAPELEFVSFSECLAIKGKENCQLRYNPLICIAIALSSFIKMTAMIFTARISCSRKQPLLTVGDAVESFLKKTDSMTEGLWLMSKADFCRGDWKTVHDALQNGANVESGILSKHIPHKQLSKPKRWMRAASIWLWLTALFLCCACIALGVYPQIIWKPFDVHASFQSLGSWPGFLVASYPGSHSIGTVVMANLPQVFISASYFSYNIVLTDMLAAAEYSSYGAVYKPLRVTRPVKGSQQQSTYWLSVPYKYGLPMLIAHVNLHWLVSQSFYFIMTTPYDVHDNLDKDGIYSSIIVSTPPIFLSIVLVAAMWCFLVVLSFNKFRSNIPLAGSCSAAISAACHPPRHENLDTIALGSVMWMKTTEQPMDNPGRLNSREGYCSFTSAGTREP